MVVDQAPREVRRIWPTAGVGGFIELLWRAIQDDPEPTDSMQRIEVGLWTIQFRYRNVELPESGGGGAMGVYRVAESFRFTAETVLSFAHERPDAPAVQPTESAAFGNPFQPFHEERFRGQGHSGQAAAFPDCYRVQMKFQFGDPERIGPDAAGSFYFCPGVMIEEIIPTNPSRPPFDVARATIKGVGAEPMQRWVEDVPISGNVFDFRE